jgi:hypothetical protein
MPDTTNYMILGYAITVLILFAMILYVALKARNLRAEYRTLESLEEEDKAKSETTAEATPSVATTPPRQNLVSR